MKLGFSGLKMAAQAGCLALPLIQAACLPATAQEGPPPGREMGPPPGGRGPGRPGPDKMGPGPGGMQDGGPLMGLAHAEADQAAGEAIAALANAPLADVQRVVRTWDVPTALRYFDVAPKAFHDAVVPRLVAVVKAAQQEQRISAPEADRMIGQLQHDLPHPPE